MTIGKAATILGYVEQNPARLEMVNNNKVTEEGLLRMIEQMQGESGDYYNDRCLALAFTKFQEAFMWLNRGVMQPRRLTDEEYMSGMNVKED